MNYCEDCGCKVYDGACTNCHEEIFILKQYEDLEMEPPPSNSEFMKKVNDFYNMPHINQPTSIKQREMRFNTVIEIIYKSDKAKEPIKIRATLLELIKNVSWDDLERIEPPCNSGSCNTESQNFCDCGGIYEDYSLFDAIVVKPDQSTTIKQ